MRLDDRAALIVGGGQTPGATMGNGRATALTFARAGARVAIADRRLESAEETAHMVTEAGGEAIALALDVREEEQIKAAIQTTHAAFGRLDILHNNVGVAAGAGHRDARIESIEADAYTFLVEVNLRGMVLTSKHALPLMREAGRGVVLNISSLAALKPYPLVGYKTTKAGVIAFTEQIAANYARFGVRANVILPGLMETPMAVEGQVGKKRRDEIVAERDAQVPLGRKMGTAWDVANAALFLASDLAQYITGAVLPVDGGLSVS
ncbi:MAG: SDR family NAD(P)-dependent oxidoreductase [Pseudomonadales bacterium]